MNEITTQNYATLPSTENDRNKILAAIKEIDISLTRIDSEKDLIKEIADDLKEEFGMGKRLVNRLASTFHKGNQEEIAEQFKEYKEFIEGLT